MEVAEENMASGFLWTHLKKGNNNGCDQETCKNWCIKDLQLLFSRVIGLQTSSRETIHIQNLLSDEFALVPTYMFTDSGDMRIEKSKAQLKTQLQVELSTRKISQEMQCRVLGFSTVLWVIHWPLNGKLRHYVANCRKKIFHHNYTQNNKLVVTGSNNIPVRISHGVVIYREDISTYHEEADCIIVQQTMMASEYQQGVSVIAIQMYSLF